jgi:hypothetical protein
VDPFAVLGVAPGSPPDEVLAAYRGLAKRWHPDRAGGAEGALRMAQINAAYDMVRTLSVTPIPLPGTGAQSAGRDEDRAPGGPARPPRGAAGGAGRGGGGFWLPEATRRRLGRELLQALAEGEEVPLVTPVATWASPRAVLAATDRRLLWLLDDAVSHRVRSLAFSAIAEVEHGLRRPLRRRAVLRVSTRTGRRLAFADLAPETAAAIAAHVSAAGRAR